MPPRRETPLHSARAHQPCSAPWKRVSSLINYAERGTEIGEQWDEEDGRELISEIALQTLSNARPTDRILYIVALR